MKSWRSCVAWLAFTETLGEAGVHNQGVASCVGWLLAWDTNGWIGVGGVIWEAVAQDGVTQQQPRSLTSAVPWHVLGVTPHARPN